MVGNLNRRSKRIQFNKEKNMLSETKDTGENKSEINKDFVIDLFKNVRYYYSGILDERVSWALVVGQAKLCSYLSSLCDYYIIGKNSEIEESIDLDVPVVSQNWVLGSVKCGKLLPAAAFSLSPSKDQLMSGARVCISGVGRPDACSIWAMVKFNGGQVDTRLTQATTHLVATSDQGKLYEEALARNDVFVVTPDWVTDSVRRKIKCIENLYDPRLLDTSGYDPRLLDISGYHPRLLDISGYHPRLPDTSGYHPRLLDISGMKLINTAQLAPTDQHEDAAEIKTVSETTSVEDYSPETTTLGVKPRSITNFFNTSSERMSPSRSESIKKKVKIENKAEEINKLKEKDLKMRKVHGSFKKLLPFRRGRGRPKGPDSKHPRRKEKAGKKSTKIKKDVAKLAILTKAAEAKNSMDCPFRNSDSGPSTIKSKIKPQKINQQYLSDKANDKSFSIDQNQNKIMEVEQVKTAVIEHLNDQTVSLNPTTQQRKYSNIETISVNPSAQQLASQYPTNQIKSSPIIKQEVACRTNQIKMNPIVEQEVACRTNQIKMNPIVEQEVTCPINQIKINPITSKKVARNRRNNQIVSDDLTTQIQHATQSHCPSTSPNLMNPSTTIQSNDSYQTSQVTEEKQIKLSSSPKRKLVEKEIIGKVSKKLKWGKFSKLPEMSNSTEGYSCQICDKAFAQRSNLMVHIKMIHEGIRFPCPMCDLTVSTKSNLKRHMATQHNVQRHNIVNNNVKMDDSVKEDVIEDTVTCHPNQISSPAMTHTSHDSFHTLQLAKEKQNVKPDLPLPDNFTNPIVKLSPQLKSSNCTQHQVRNGPQDEDLKQQEYAPNQPSKLQQTATDSQPVLSLSVYDVQRHQALLPHVQRHQALLPHVQRHQALLPLPKSKHLLSSAPATPENIKEISPMVRNWTVEETITQVSLLDPKLASYVQIFRSHEIDGRALLMLTPENMMKYLDMKLGPALKIGNIVEKLRGK